MGNKSNEEVRSVGEFRADTDSSNLSGYAAEFLTVDSYHSTFGRSAFKKTLRERGSTVPLLSNHDSGMVIGKTTELRTDSRGLKFRAMVVEETTAGKDIMALVRAEVLNGMSFGFRTIKDRSGTDADGIDMTGLPSQIRAADIRFIEEVALKEISVVTFPSNPRSRIDSYRSEMDAEELVEEFLDTIRSAELTPEQIQKISDEIRAIADALEVSEPNDTQKDESRYHNDSIDIDLLLVSLSGLE